MRSRMLVLVPLLLALGGAAHAKGPRMVLPLAGLALDLKSEPDVSYALTSRWSLDEKMFEGRDIVTETRAGITSATWLSIGWFSAGGCYDVLERLPIEQSWSRLDVALWGRRWLARGGVARSPDAPSGAMIVALCRVDGDRKPVLLSHLFPPPAGPPSADDALAQLERASIPSAIARSLRQRQYVASHPTDPALGIEHHGDAATRRASLFWADLDVDLPDDGAVWIDGADVDGVDVFERVAPALPELSVVLARLDGDVQCSDALDAMGGALVRKAPRGMPKRWVYGRTTARAEYRAIALCLDTASGILLAGVASTNQALDVTSAAPLLEAIARAADRAGSSSRRTTTPDLSSLFERWHLAPATRATTAATGGER